MSEANSAPDRAGGIAGLAGTVVSLAALPLAPQWPKADAGADEIRSYFTANGHSFLVQTLVLWVGFVILLRFYTGLAVLIVKGGTGRLGYMALAGVAMMTLAIFAGNAPWAALAYAPSADNSVLLALWNLGLVSAFNGASIAVVAAALPLGLGVLHIRSLPRWLGALWLLCAAINLFAAGCFARSGLFSPNGPFALASILSIIVASTSGSIVLLRRASVSQ